MPFPVLSAPRGLVDVFNIGPLTVDRRGSKTLNKYGAWETPPPTTFVIDPVAAHPISGKDLDRVPEADRTKEVVEFYGRVASFPAGVEGFYVAGPGRLPDVILYRGRRYRVVQAQDYFLQGDVWLAFGEREDAKETP